jgi:hypothetical protein
LTIGDEIVQFWQTIDLDALGGPVRWAGPEAQPFWLDVARDYTEYWTHQQQICDASGRPGLTNEHYLGPVIDTFRRAVESSVQRVDVLGGLIHEYRRAA